MEKEKKPLSPTELHNLEDRQVEYEDVLRWECDHLGRPKVDHVINGTNGDRHLDNLSRFTGYYQGVYYYQGVAQYDRTMG